MQALVAFAAILGYRRFRKKEERLPAACGLMNLDMRIELRRIQLALLENIAKDSEQVLAQRNQAWAEMGRAREWLAARREKLVGMEAHREARFKPAESPAGRVPSKPTMPLHEAVRKGDMAETESNIHCGADVNAVDAQGALPLHFAVKSTRAPVDFVKLLLKNGADPNPPDKDGGTPLHYAAWLSAPLVVEALLAAGADANAGHFRIQGVGGGLNPLHLAALDGKCAAAKLLIGAGAKVNARTENGLTPLHLVCLSNGKVETVEVLVAGGADVNATDEKGWTPLYYACCIIANLPVAKALLASGADIQHKYEKGASLLHLAAEGLPLEVVEFLLSHGADVDARNGSNLAPLDIAEGQGRTEVVAALVAHGAGKGAKGQEETKPLPKASEEEPLDMTMDEAVLGDQEGEHL
ncbi:MAG: ankyrin repeat domain-containing protein [Planctomycetota bacterium]